MGQLLISDEIAGCMELYMSNHLSWDQIDQSIEVELYL